jgi:hypothetical protein
MPNFDEEKLIQSLVELYRQGFLNVLKVILEKEAKKQNTVYFKDILKQIIEILEQLDQNAAKWIEENVPKIYQKNYVEVMAFIKQLKGEAIQNPSFSQIHQRAIDVLAQNLYDNLRDATQFVGRKFDDYFRKASLEAAGRKYVSGETWQQMKKNLMEDLLSKGLTGFKDRLGREWRLDSYAEMVARTLTREAATVATINACQEFDIDLVKISTHYPTCHLCAPIQGKVYSLSGKDKRYPKYGEDGVVIPRHPNCRHVLMPYVRELDPNAEETEKYSNTSLTEDPRSEKEKQDYKEMRDKVTIQTIRRRAREVLYNEQAPLIERLKAAGKLKKSYEKVGDKINNIDKHYLNELDKYLANLNINNIVKIDDERGIITIKGTANKSTKAFPNAVIDLINPKLNKIIQRRFYDEKGNAEIDIDLTDHNKPWAHDVPHVHEWIDGKRSKKWRKPTEQEKEFIKDIWDGDDV